MAYLWRVIDKSAAQFPEIKSIINFQKAQYKRVIVESLRQD